MRKKERLSISPAILWQIKAIWEPEAENPDKAMLWAACCLGFFCFLGFGEMTVPCDQDFDQSVHLTKKDLAVDSQTAPNSL